MTNQIATTKEQSQRLITCGVNPKSADFVWLAPNNYLSLDRGCNKAMMEVGDIPAWSLSTLLALLPPTITSSPYEDEDPDGEYDECDYDLFINPSMSGKQWYVSYSHNEIGEYSDDLYETGHPSLIEAVVQMIETLTSHKRKLNETKQCHDLSD